MSKKAEPQILARVSSLAKSFNHVPAVKSISFEIKRGETFGLLGPNGAGKTTTINMLATYLRPDSGDALIDGKSVNTDELEVKKIIGFVPQEIALYSDLTARENLIFFGSIYSQSKTVIQERTDELLEFVGLKDETKKRVKQFSGGMKRRLNIAAGLMNRPVFLMMDEPTVGIDPQSRENIYELIGRIKEQGTTILYTSHYMEEVEKLCDTIAIMDHGTIIASGTLGELLKLKKKTHKVYRPSGLEELFIQLTGSHLRD
ncbi:ABC transporter ATP-binding protein [Candidatus Wirthbacteria bacterium CG2_30_54_11]|uniref:ABC transporter ATP-binding protein n=1 Tax=Candidatus Wirthbacteria bacterium CG2_30_54_11 TaxID=1817892 RepID=A0A1J5ITJ3_9BACT|nr:MAG: ABC transporter ATP-binding protein [Candidatus Wirthbacteria bacterium CG2_30_54_11]